MIKVILALAIGVTAGYRFGWHDAKTNEHTVVERTLEKIGGTSRDRFRNDVDTKMERLEKR